VWIVSFHSTSYNAFVFRVHGSQDAKQENSINNQHPATKTSIFLQLPYDSPVHFEQLHVPAAKASTGQQADNNCHSTLNDITTRTITASTGQQADKYYHSTLNDATTSTTKASNGLQADNYHHSMLNDVTSPQALSATTATTTATMSQVHAITIMTQVHAIAIATTKAKLLKLDECFLHPAKTGANNATIKSEILLLHAQIGSAITIALNTQNL
jgi:hypothetical protein